MHVFNFIQPHAAYNLLRSTHPKKGRMFARRHIKQVDNTRASETWFINTILNILSTDMTRKPNKWSPSGIGHYLLEERGHHTRSSMSRGCWLNSTTLTGMSSTACQ